MEQYVKRKQNIGKIVALSMAMLFALGLPVKAADQGGRSVSESASTLDNTKKGKSPDLDKAKAAGAAANAAVAAVAEKQAAEAERQLAISMDPELSKAQIIPDKDDKVTFTFAGDILFDPYYAAGATIQQRGITNCFDETALKHMRDADIFVINNEFTYTNSNKPLANKKYTFHADPSYAQDLKEIGTDLVTLANNHTFDYGEIGLTDTLDALDAIEMPRIGAGRNIEEASAAKFYLAGDMTIAILSATQIERYATAHTRGATETQAGVFRCYDPTLLYQVVREVKEKADFVIVCMHWGTEKKTTTDPAQVEQAKGLAEAGCDLIIGDHPHILQEIAFVDGMPVIYSLGNYLFTSYTTDTGVLQVTLEPSTKTISKIRFVPMQQVNCSVKTLTGSEKKRVLDKMRSMSPTVTIDDNGVVTSR